MYLTRLMYVSELTPGVDIDVPQILESARRNNAKAEVTGALWFGSNLFIQVLEGGRRAVSSTYHKIAADSRHGNIELVECRVVSERIFHKWTMGYHADTGENRSRVLRYSGHNELIPREMSPESLLGFLSDLNLSDKHY
ncbi:MAG: BLUF domain-containing protein [Kordiimonas sp.]